MFAGVLQLWRLWRLGRRLLLPWTRQLIDHGWLFIIMLYYIVLVYIVVLHSRESYNLPFLIRAFSLVKLQGTSEEFMNMSSGTRIQSFLPEVLFEWHE